MEPRLRDDGKPSVSRFLGSALIFSILAVLASCHGTCKHRVPAPSEVSPGQTELASTIAVVAK